MSKVTTKQKDSTPSSSRKVKNGAKKGKQFEREVANILGHIFPEAKRHLEYQADEALAGEDLSGTDRIKIQCKNHQNYVPVGTIKEVRTKDPDDIPVLVTKGNRLEAMAVLPFEKFVTLLEIAYGLELPFRTFDEEPIQRKVLTTDERLAIETSSVLIEHKPKLDDLL